jgi:cell division protein FtsZ
VISNDKLRHQFGNLKMREAFAKADNVLATAAKCITDVINSTGQINVDFADVCTVMKNGGVAILGNAACEGENRAQRAIEEALNSPLLNDSEIKGAKWILININSSEGEHEFTMDEVDIIQNYLIGQAGEDTDVILGLGYDNSLGSQIGITLIATGFQHKNPFSRKEATKPDPKKEDKILMTLGFEAENKNLATIKKAEAPIDPMAPKLVEDTMISRDEEIPMPRLTDADLDLHLTEDELVEEIEPTIHLQLKVKEEKEEIADAEKMELELKKKKLEEKFEQLHRTIVSQSNPAKQNINPASAASGGYLARPSNIYAETKKEVSTSKPAEEPVPAPVAKIEDEESINMQLVIRNDIPAADVPKAHQAQTPKPQADEPALQDVAEDQKRKAAERLQKLRNLSFNVNSADPNNEFESVPAYIRRNMELFNNSSSVENFYSNYTVKPDGNNGTRISTINTFLDGKKPD